MKTTIIRGKGIQGINLTLSVCDMFAANQMANELKTVIDNHEKVEQYRSLPYDKRNEQFPQGQPTRKDLSDGLLEMLYTLMCKMSYSATSTIFSEEDEPNGADYDIDDHK